jgi:hypothetical protein
MTRFHAQIMSGLSDENVEPGQARVARVHVSEGPRPR